MSLSEKDRALIQDTLGFVPLFGSDKTYLSLRYRDLAAILQAAREEAYKEGWNDREGDLIAGVTRIIPEEPSQEGAGEPVAGDEEALDTLWRAAHKLYPTSPPTDPQARIAALEWNGRVHDLKTWPAPFAAIRADLKPWEFRFNDRDYQVGDKLRLREWSPADESYTGEIEERLVPWILNGGQFGVPKGFAIMSLARADLTPTDQAATKGDDHGA